MTKEITVNKYYKLASHEVREELLECVKKYGEEKVITTLNKFKPFWEEDWNKALDDLKGIKRPLRAIDIF